MDNVFFFKTVKVKPLIGSQMLDENNSAKGAFLSCVAPGESSNKALAYLKKILLEDCYEFISVEEVIEFSKVKWFDESDEIFFKSLAWNAITENSVGYGVFKCFETQDVH